VIDHLARTGLSDGRRQAGRAGDAQVWLEAIHGNLLDGGQGVRGWSHDLTPSRQPVIYADI
jgi:hypothetical protein